MALSDSDATRFYNAIVTKSRELKLDWILRQVEEQLALGSVSSKDLKDLAVRERSLFGEEEVFEMKGQERKGSKATFLVSKPYTAQERLDLLVDSLLIGIVHLNQIIEAITTFAASELKSSTIEFAPEADVKVAFRLKVGDARVAESSTRLSNLLNELKREISDGR